jgi:CRP-like cAMP-binding protein
MLFRKGDPRGMPGRTVITLAAAKAAIASQLNLTPERFSRLLHDLADAGLVHVEGRKITVPDVHRLEAAAHRRRS